MHRRRPRRRAAHATGRVTAASPTRPARVICTILVPALPNPPNADRWDRGPSRRGCVRRAVVASRRLVTVNESVDEALSACPARRGVRLRSHAKDRDRTWRRRGHLLHRAGGGGAAHDRLLGPVFLCRRLGRTEPRGRAAGSLRAGADRGRLDRRLPVATTFEPIERAKSLGPAIPGTDQNTAERGRSRTRRPRRRSGSSTRSRGVRAGRSSAALGYEGFGVRVGVDTGPVVVGALGAGQPRRVRGAGRRGEHRRAAPGRRRAGDGAGGGGDPSPGRAGVRLERAARARAQRQGRTGDRATAVEGVLAGAGLRAGSLEAVQARLVGRERELATAVEVVDAVARRRRRDPVHRPVSRGSARAG